MELLKPFLSLGAVSLIIFAVGVVLTEGYVDRKTLLVPRGRKDRYFRRGISFLELTANLMLAYVAFALHKETGSAISLALIIIAVGAMLLKFALWSLNLEKLQDYFDKSDKEGRLRNFLLLLWCGGTIALLQLPATEAERLLSYVMITYLLLLVAFIVANVTKNYYDVHIEITLKSGVIMPVTRLLDEKSDYFVLGNPDASNLLVSKSDVSTARVWLVEQQVQILTTK